MRCHRRAAVAVNDQLIRRDLLFFDRFADQPLGQIGTLGMGQHPADGAAAVDVDDRVEVVIGPFLGAFELGDVPRPDFIRAAGQQFRLLVLGMRELVATLADALVFVEDAIHRSDTAQVLVFIKQRGVDLTRRLVGKSLTVEFVKHGLTLGF